VCAAPLSVVINTRRDCRRRRRRVVDNAVVSHLTYCCLPAQIRPCLIRHRLLLRICRQSAGVLRYAAKCLFVHTNVLISWFRHCCKNVKLVLFRSFCLCMYDVALWKYYSVTAFNKFKAALKSCLGMQEEKVCRAYYWISVFQPLTLLCIILVFCLRVIACCRAIRSFSGLLPLLCIKFTFYGF